MRSSALIRSHWRFTSAAVRASASRYGEHLRRRGNEQQARELAEQIRAGKRVIPRHGKPADPDDFRGVYRLRLRMEGDPTSFEDVAAGEAPDVIVGERAEVYRHRCPTADEAGAHRC